MILRSLLWSLKRLPANLRTIRPYARGSITPWYWSLRFDLWLDCAPPHEHDPYLFHFNEASLALGLGPFQGRAGLKDTN